MGNGTNRNLALQAKLRSSVSIKAAGRQRPRHSLGISQHVMVKRSRRAEGDRRRAMDKRLAWEMMPDWQKKIRLRFGAKVPGLSVRD